MASFREVLKLGPSSQVIPTHRLRNQGSAGSASGSNIMGKKQRNEAREGERDEASGKSEAGTSAVKMRSSNKEENGDRKNIEGDVDNSKSDKKKGKEKSQAMKSTKSDVDTKKQRKKDRKANRMEVEVDTSEAEAGTSAVTSKADKKREEKRQKKERKAARKAAKKAAKEAKKMARETKKLAKKEAKEAVMRKEEEKNMRRDKKGMHLAQKEATNKKKSASALAREKCKKPAIVSYEDSEDGDSDDDDDDDSEDDSSYEALSEESVDILADEMTKKYQVKKTQARNIAEAEKARALLQKEAMEKQAKASAFKSAKERKAKRRQSQLSMPVTDDDDDGVGDGDGDDDEVDVGEQSEVAKKQQAKTKRRQSVFSMPVTGFDWEDQLPAKKRKVAKSPAGIVEDEVAEADKSPTFVEVNVDTNEGDTNSNSEDGATSSGDDATSSEDEEGELLYSDEDEVPGLGTMFPGVQLGVDEEEFQQRDDPGDGSVSGDDESADDEAEPDEEFHQSVYHPSYKKKRVRTRQPFSDDDPDKDDSDTQDYPPDEDGWTRNNRKVKPHAFTGPMPRGPNQDPEKVKTVLDYFFSFFPLSLFAQIASWTNKVISKAKEKKQQTTTKEEIKAWFGIHFVMGCVRIRNYKNYWSTKPGWYNHLIARTMSRKRYEFLTGALQLCDPDTNPLSWSRSTIMEKQHFYCHIQKHPIFALQPLWDKVREACRKNYNAAQDLALDEAMIAYKGSKSALRRVFMPQKPTRVGFKIYAIAESLSGYMLVFDHQQNLKESMPNLVLRMMQPLTGLYHHLYTDRAYTSVEAAKRLLAVRTYITGSIPMNATGLSKDFTSNKKKNPHPERLTQMNSTPRGTQYYRQNNNLTHVLWKDSKICSLLSTAHNAFRNKDRDFITRSFSTSPKEKAKEHEVPAPPQAISYNKNYGGVDKADQLRAYFSTDRKTQKWWFHVLYFLIDVCAVNSRICFNFRQEKQWNSSKFAMELAEQLIAGYVTPGRRHRQDYRIPKTLPATSTQHIFQRMDVQHAKACVGCLKTGKKAKGGKGKRERRTMTGCLACNLHFCWDCFIKYHPSQDPDMSTSPSPMEESD